MAACGALIALGCGGGSANGAQGSTSTAGSMAPSGRPVIEWEVHVIDAASPDQPRVTRANAMQGEIALSGTRWRCDITSVEARRESGHDGELRRIICAYGEEYAALSKTCLTGLDYEHQSIDVVTLFEGNARVSLGLGCRVPGANQPAPASPIRFGLVMSTPGGQTPLQLYEGRRPIPVPSSTQWQCQYEPAAPNPQWDQGLIVECASTVHDIGVAGLAGCFSSGPERRFSLLDIGVGHGESLVEIQLACSSLPQVL